MDPPANLTDKLGTFADRFNVCERLAVTAYPRWHRVGRGSVVALVAHSRGAGAVLLNHPRHHLLAVVSEKAERACSKSYRIRDSVVR
jgi:hypothetical protein